MTIVIVKCLIAHWCNQTILKLTLKFKQVTKLTKNIISFQNCLVQVTFQGLPLIQAQLSHCKPKARQPNNNYETILISLEFDCATVDSYATSAKGSNNDKNFSTSQLQGSSSLSQISYLFVAVIHKKNL